MNDDPERKQHRGQVRRLEDTDGDGRFDKATVFAKGLRWPSAIHCYGGGVFVGSVPDLLYFEDTNDDGRQFLCRQHRHIITVRLPLGVEVVVARAQIAKMQASKLSLMPEGLEEGLTSRDLADLMDFIFADVQ